MKLIYIAGPYRADTEWRVNENVREAERIALNAWRAGASVICPHKNTERFGGAYSLPDSTWLDGDMEMLSRCDGAYFTQDWVMSEGSRAEHLYCRQNGVPILYDSDIELSDRDPIEMIRDWLATFEEKGICGKRKKSLSSTESTSP